MSGPSSALCDALVNKHTLRQDVGKGSLSPESQHESNCVSLSTVNRK